MKTLTGLLAILFFWLWWVIDDYDKLSKNYQDSITRLNQLVIRHSQELASAKNEIDKLCDVVDRHTEQVYINVNCSKFKGTDTPSMNGANPIRTTTDIAI